jgi:hypothetical protein
MRLPLKKKPCTGNDQAKRANRFFRHDRATGNGRSMVPLLCSSLFPRVDGEQRRGTVLFGFAEDVSAHF